MLLEVLSRNPRHQAIRRHESVTFYSLLYLRINLIIGKTGKQNRSLNGGSQTSALIKFQLLTFTFKLRYPVPEQQRSVMISCVVGKSMIIEEFTENQKGAAWENGKQ